LPSLTVITMFEYVPMSPAPGVPNSRPVDVLKSAQLGSFSIENVTASPFGWFAGGGKLYCWPCITWLGGVPEIVGGAFVAPLPTVIENGPIESLPPLPSLTVITMPEYVPASDALGVPCNRPFDSKSAQLGRFWIENVNASP